MSSQSGRMNIARVNIEIFNISLKYSSVSHGKEDSFDHLAHVILNQIDNKTCGIRSYGMSFHIGENIIQVIDSSRKVILIITENFLNSDSGLYELEVTRMHAFQRDNDNMVIVVIKNDIP
jgi:hypothetical protein